MSSTDLTTSILREIRDEIRTTNAKLDETRTELKTEIAGLRTELKAELADVRGELKAELQVVGTTLKDLSGQLVMLVRYAKNTSERHDKDIDRHDKEIEDLRERVARLEGAPESR